ncbi:hypothetical protein [Streptomyces sp. NPDC055085]
MTKRSAFLEAVSEQACMCGDPCSTPEQWLAAYEANLARRVKEIPANAAEGDFAYGNGFRDGLTMAAKLIRNQKEKS